MDSRHRVIHDGRVLVEGRRIAGVWGPGQRPPNVRVAGVPTIERGPKTLLYPGLINLHDHPNYDVLPPWPPPASDAIPAVHKRGSQPYDNRYEWNGAKSISSPDEYTRLVANPSDAIIDLGLVGEEEKYGEVGDMLGGETTTEGGSANPASDGALIRNVENAGFNDRIPPGQVGPIGKLVGKPLNDLRAAMRDGRVDAWLVHLAEGVRNRDRRRRDTASSRSEFRTLESKGLLTDETVIIHGTALERSDFAAMRAAPSPRNDGSGDGRGAKLVWSPRSNLSLYGKTTNVYAALAEHVLVSLGTDWTPSGSHTLLDELKVADRAVRDPRLLGPYRHLVPRLDPAGRSPAGRRRAEVALDRELVDEVTRNPARTLHWYRYVGSIEPGKRADLLLIRKPPGSSQPGVPSSVYRRLIDASERDVQLVTVDGAPLAGSVGLFRRLRPNDYEVVRSPTGSYRKAVDVTVPPGSGVPDGRETFARIRASMTRSLAALGGDSPPPGGGPAGPGNTYSYLKAHIYGGALAGTSDAKFRAILLALFGTDSAGRLNLEAIAPIPVLGHDRLGTAMLNGYVDPATGLLADPWPPFKLYPADLNQITARGNPLAGLR